MKKLILTSLALCLFSQFANAEAYPKGSRFDNRVKTVAYNPDNVTRINIKAGISSLIQLHKNEQITGVGLGDSEAWNVNVNGSNIWIKPIAEQPDTNLTITTDKRTYFFNLVTVKNKSAASWGIRFDYPDMKKPMNTYVKPCSGIVQNYRYFVQGDNKAKQIFPIEAWDNGTFTCLRFPIGGDLPVVFKKLPDGKEGLVNSHIENDVVVIHEINKEYRIRLGDLVAGLKTDVKNTTLGNKSTTNGKTREVLDE